MVAEDPAIFVLGVKKIVYHEHDAMHWSLVLNKAQLRENQFLYSEGVDDLVKRQKAQALNNFEIQRKKINFTGKTIFKIAMIIIIFIIVVILAIVIIDKPFDQLNQIEKTFECTLPKDVKIINFNENINCYLLTNGGNSLLEAKVKVSQSEFYSIKTYFSNHAGDQTSHLTQIPDLGSSPFNNWWHFEKKDVVNCYLTLPSGSGIISAPINGENNIYFVKSADSSDYFIFFSHVM